MAPLIRIIGQNQKARTLSTDPLSVQIVEVRGVSYKRRLRRIDLDIEVIEIGCAVSPREKSHRRVFENTPNFRRDRRAGRPASHENFFLAWSSTSGRTPPGKPYRPDRGETGDLADNDRM